MSGFVTDRQDRAEDLILHEGVVHLDLDNGGGNVACVGVVLVRTSRDKL